MVRIRVQAAVVPSQRSRWEDPQVLLIRQYRYAAEGYLYEIPAGRLIPRKVPAPALSGVKGGDRVFADAWMSCSRYVHGLPDSLMRKFIFHGNRTDIWRTKHELMNFSNCNRCHSRELCR